MQEAVSAWVTVYMIAKPMNLAQVLQALANLAPQLGLPEGLEGWERLAQQMQSEAAEENEESAEEQVTRFVQAVVRAVRDNSAEAPQFFDAVSKMAVDPKAPSHYRELGKVLQQYMSGVQHPDLSALPQEFAEIVRKALDEAG